jgi:hypothetical protein
MPNVMDERMDEKGLDRIQLAWSLKIGAGNTAILCSHQSVQSWQMMRGIQHARVTTRIVHSTLAPLAR